MYFAISPITIPVRDSQGKSIGKKIILPGEPIPETATAEWSYPTYIAHLNLHMIEWKGDGVAPHEAHKIRSGKTCDVNKYREARPRPAPPVVAEEKKVVRPSVKGPAHLPREAAPRKLVDPRTVAQDLAPKATPKEGVQEHSSSKQRKKAAKQAKAG